MEREENPPTDPRATIQAARIQIALIFSLEGFLYDGQGPETLDRHAAR